MNPEERIYRCGVEAGHHAACEGEPLPDYQPKPFAGAFWPGHALGFYCALHDNLTEALIKEGYKTFQRINGGSAK